MDYFFCPALPLEEVVDPTGAGDSFAGGFIGHLASLGKTDFESMKEAVVVGSALASFTCEAFGSEGISSVDHGSLNARLDQFRKMTRWEEKKVALAL